MSKWVIDVAVGDVDVADGEVLSLMAKLMRMFKWRSEKLKVETNDER